MIIPRLPKIAYGGDYNPEQWPPSVWLEDVRLMREAGVNLVSLGIFSWALLEPRPGEYDFSMLDTIMDLLHEHGVLVALATATASPPPWLARLHPESLPVTADGTILWPGARQHYCPSSSAYRDAAAALVRRLAERYRDHPALALWHINNEYGCHVAECYCDASAAAFRAWLERRYGTIDRLNAAWATTFWSQRYDSWDEIVPPRTMPSFANPTQALDFKRFSSDALLSLFQMERAIVKQVTPDIPVTTNFINFALDYWRWAAHEDVVSFDSYPDPSDPVAHVDAAMKYDLMRSLGGGKPWILMEQAPSHVNWRAHNVPKRPGQMRLWSLQAVAHGADAVMFFQWRASAAGAEKFHSAMIPHAGLHTRTWREVVGLGADLARLSAVQGARVPAAVAIMIDWDSWWALETPSKPSSSVRLMEQLRRYYDPLHRRNVPVDFVAADADLAAYRVVLVPSLYLMTGRTAELLERFVAGGGTLVVSFFSGIANEDDHVYLDGGPVPLRRLLGLRVEEYVPYAPEQSNSLITDTGESYSCDLWSDIVELEGAESLATFTHDFYAGRAAVTRHRYGAGTAYYVGTRPADAYLAALLARVCSEAAVEGIDHAPPGVEVLPRVAGAVEYLFVLNHTQENATVQLAGTYRDLLQDRNYQEAIELAPYGVAVLTRV